MTHPSPSAGPVRHLCRYEEPLTAGEGLTRVQDALARWGLDTTGDQALDAVLVAGELLANARRHAGGIRVLELCWGDAKLRIAVSDGDPQPPQLVWPHSPGRPSGHGLHVVERLAVRWGSTVHADGKTVWAEIALPAQGRPPRRRS